MVAAVSGFALGGGCELALVCDLIVASETAEFGQPEITLGIIPGGGGTQRLARTVGKQRGMELVLTGRRFDARDAERIGIVNVVAKKREWLDAALDLARRIASRPPIATRLAKQAVLAAEETSMSAGLDTSTVTPGSTAPLSSFSWPLIVAVPLCATARPENRINPTTSAAVRAP